MLVTISKVLFISKKEGSEHEQYSVKSRSEVIEDIERVLPYLNDTDMAELSNRIIGKLRNMTDEEFEQLELIGAEVNVAGIKNCSLLFSFSVKS